MKLLDILTTSALTMTLALGLTFMPISAFSQEEEACTEYTLDTNEDGIISEEEFTAFGDAYDDFDANDDGVLTEDEFNECASEVWGGTPGGGDDDGPLFGLLDVTDDQQLSEDEFFSEDNFGELDDNESGVLEEDEFGTM